MLVFHHRAVAKKNKLYISSRAYTTETKDLHRNVSHRPLGTCPAAIISLRQSKQAIIDGRLHFTADETALSPAKDEDGYYVHLG